jgi:hypothetical protein
VTFVWLQSLARWHLTGVKTTAGNQTSALTVTTSTSPLAAAAGLSYFYLVNSASATTQTLPTAVNNTNYYVIKNIAAGAVTIATTSSQTIDGTATQSLSTLNQTIRLISDGANWRIV